VALLLRAITLPPESLDAGLEHILRVDHGRLTVWADEMDQATTLGRDDLLSHHRKVSAIFSRVDSCLPARFPSWADSPEAVQTLLQWRSNELARRLESLRGCCELAVTAVWLTPRAACATSESPKRTGRDYLLARRRAIQHSDRRRELAKAIADELQSRARQAAEVTDVRQRLSPSTPVALSMALMVRRDQAQDVIALFARGADDVRILVNGPWAPYSFAGVGPDLGDR
jgi:hypothetical protein